MKKLPVTEWAAIAEIVGTAAVIVSLLLVVQSLNLNTRAIQATNDNFIYGLQDAHLDTIIASKELSAITKKAFEKKELDELEAFRWQLYLGRFLNLWEVIFTRHEVGLMPDEAWETWDRSAIGTFNSLVPIELWQQVRVSANASFREHVDRIAAEREQ